MRIILRAAYLVFIAMAVPSMALANGSCVDYIFPLKSDSISVNTTRPLRVLSHGAPVFKGAEGDEVVRRMDFQTTLYPVSVSAQSPSRVEVKLRRKPIGWMERKDLLCVIRPLLSSRGLERKLFIKTQPETNTKVSKVTAYPSPVGESCFDLCRELSRFELYFIVAEMEGRYLLTNRFNLNLSPPLVGWVEAKNGIPWNTALGLRPGEEVEQVAAYRTFEGAQRRVHPEVTFLGGKRWYGYSNRVPLLDSDPEREHYKIAAPGVGVEAFEEPSLEVIEAMTDVDVFFLLDGTFSMQPQIDAALAAVRNIKSTLLSDRRYQDTYFRFGFRVFRDNFAGNGGIGEGVPLSNQGCGQRNPSEREPMAINHKRFEEKLEGVETSTNDPGANDKYPEQLFAGIRQAAKDFRGCPNHTKILFIIGDAGDNIASVPGDLKTLLSRFPKLLAMFVQASERERNSVTSWESYKAAYDRFEDQGKSLLRQVLPIDFRGVEINSEAYFLTLDAQKVPEEIKRLVAEFARSDVVADITLNLRAGHSLDQIIEKYMRSNDLPVLYLSMLHRAACLEDEQLGEQCTARVDHRIIEAWAPVSDEWVEEVWVTAKELQDWIYVLEPLSRIDRGEASEKRDQFVETLVQTLQTILGQPPIKESGETLEQYVAREEGLPGRRGSPLLQYEIKEILEMEDCELNRLIEWVGDVRRLLVQVMGTPELKPTFTLNPYSESQCLSASEKGRNIPDIIFGSPEPLGAEYSYSNMSGDEQRFWLPRNFLP